MQTGISIPPLHFLEALRFLPGIKNLTILTDSATHYLEIDSAGAIGPLPYDEDWIIQALARQDGSKASVLIRQLIFDNNQSAKSTSNEWATAKQIITYGAVLRGNLYFSIDAASLEEILFVKNSITRSMYGDFTKVFDNFRLSNSWPQWKIVDSGLCWIGSEN